jgi:hypothetical protein
VSSVWASNAGEAHHQRGGGFGFNRQIGEYVFHQWLFDEAFAERNAMARMMHCLGDSCAQCAERQNF